MLPRLEVSANRRFLQTAGVEPFFYLGDTAWELFHRLTFAEAQDYLRDRAAKGFNVIQATVLGELDGLRTPNAHGQVPFVDGDTGRPVPAYWEHVDRVVGHANAQGLYLGFLPTWGDKWNRGNGAGPEIFHPGNARAYGEWLGRRYAKADLIWILGGDRAIENETHRETMRAMAGGLAAGDQGAHLLTFHPPGGQSSISELGFESWLDFSMFQSGHCEVSLKNYFHAEREYMREPIRPMFDGEPCYEDHPYMDVDWTPLMPLRRYGAWEVRRAAYWSVFSGACGHTYGAQPLWMMWDTGRERLAGVARTWREALEFPGASQMKHLRDLLLAGPYFSRVPAPTLVCTTNPDPMEQIVATMAAEGGLGRAMIYTPTRRAFQFQVAQLPGRPVRVQWFDPRNGEFLPGPHFADQPEPWIKTDDYPGDEPDWCLVVDF